MFSMKSLKWVALGVVLVSFIALGFHFDLHEYVKPEVIKDFVVSFGILAPVIYVLLYAIANFIPYLAPVMSITGGLAFGTVKGTLLTVFAATVTSAFPFLTARKLGREWVNEKMQGTKYEKYTQKVDDNNFLFVLYMRLVPVLPYELQHYVAGLTKISLWKFLLATLLGIAPGTFALTFLGDSIMDVTSPKFFIAVGVFIIAIALPIAYTIIFKKDKV